MSRLLLSETEERLLRFAAKWAEDKPDESPTYKAAMQELGVADPRVLDSAARRLEGAGFLKILYLFDHRHLPDTPFGVYETAVFAVRELDRLALARQAARTDYFADAVKWARSHRAIAYIIIGAVVVGYAVSIAGGILGLLAFYRKP